MASLPNPSLFPALSDLAAEGTGRFPGRRRRRGPRDGAGSPGRCGADLRRPHKFSRTMGACAGAGAARRERPK